MNLWERRAAILASYYMEDEGKHWRDHVKARFTDFEMLVRDWRASKQSPFVLPI
jgi:hypothetical protein